MGVVLVDGGGRTHRPFGAIPLPFTIIFYHIFAEVVKFNLFGAIKNFLRRYISNKFVTSFEGTRRTIGVS